MQSMLPRVLSNEPLQNLYLSEQCGFASCEIGNKLTEEQQWANVDFVREIAKDVWG